MFCLLRINLCLAMLLFAFTSSASAQQAAGAPALGTLIAQLGAENYSAREEASEQLLEIGVAALPALKKGADDFDREIRQRCRRLLSQIAQSDLQQRIEAFLDDGTSENDYGLPLWKEFRSEYGNNQVVRQLFVEMQQQESGLLQALADQPGNTGDLLEVRSQQLQNFTQQQGRNAALGSIVTLLSAAGIRHEQVSEETHPRLFHFCHQAEFQEAIRGGPRREPLRQMVGTLVREADGGWSLYYVLDLAMKYDLKEGLPQALDVLDNASSQTHIRQLAILTVGKLGDDSHLPQVEQLFSDTTKTGSHSINDQVFHQQIGDLALAVASHIRGYELADLGFEQTQKHPYMLLHPSSVGFESDEARHAAFERYKRKHAGK